MISSQLGDYCLIQELGQGSLGCAYLAEHTFLKRKFVIKLLPEELTNSAEFVARFEKHIPLLSQLDHPHIAMIYNATRIEDNYVVVSEAIAGSSGEMINLAHYLHKKRGELSEEEILSIARQIASALDYAHSVKETFSH